MHDRGQQSSRAFHQLQFTALGFNSDGDHGARFPVYNRQNTKFPTLCAGKADAQGWQIHTQTPKLPDVATSERVSAMPDRRFSSPQDQVDFSTDGERLSWGPAGCWEPQTSHQAVAIKVGEGWDSWPAPAPCTSLCINVTLPAASLPNLPLTLPLSFPCFYFILFREAFCCFTGFIRAIKTHQCIYIYTIKQQSRIQRPKQPNKCITTSLVF